MIMPKQKKLTLATINKLNSEFDQRKTIYVCGDYPVQVDIKFRKTKIQKMILDYIIILEDLRKQKNVNEETLMRTTSLINTLIVKYFTDIPVPPIDNIEKLIQVSNALLDLGIMDVLFDGNENGFPKDQLELVKTEIDKVSKNIGQILGEMGIKAVLNETNEDDEDKGNEPS